MMIAEALVMNKCIHKVLFVTEKKERMNVMYNLNSFLLHLSNE